MSALLNSIDFPYVIGSLIKIAVFWIFIMLVVAWGENSYPRHQLEEKR